MYSSLVKSSQRWKKNVASICYTTFRAHRIFIGIEFPSRSPYSAGQPGSSWRNTIFQELPIEEQGQHWWTGRLDRTRHFDDGVTYIRVRVTAQDGRYPRLSTSILEDMNTSNWQILSDSPTLPEPLTGVSVRRQECERERYRRRYKGGETVRGPTTLPDNSGIRDGEWSIGGWYGRLLG